MARTRQQASVTSQQRAVTLANRSGPNPKEISRSRETKQTLNRNHGSLGETKMTDHIVEASPRRSARIAGTFYLLTFLTGLPAFTFPGATWRNAESARLIEAVAAMPYVDCSGPPLMWH